MMLLTAILVSSHLVSAKSAATSKDHCASLRNGVDHIVDANSVVAGALQLESMTGVNNVTFCRVRGLMPYGGNNTLNYEVWLPEKSKYNRRYLSVGNGGFAGEIDYATMLQNLNNGYAVGGCDAGHLTSENGPNMPGGYVPFLNSRAQTLAWIRDSIAMFTEPAKRLTTEFYRSVPKKTYFYGCSTGGAQGFALAQYHPHIFDGIFAGSPGNWYSHLVLSFLWNGVHANKPGAFLGQSALDLIRDNVIKKCDSIDGVRDGVIDDPTKCKFSIDSLSCRHGQASVVNNLTTCLNSTHINTVKAFYAGPGSKVYPGFAKGSESEWLVQESALYVQYAVPILQNLVYRNLRYNYTTFDFQKDVKVIDKVASPLITATSPNLDAFKARGGKLLVTQGWADPFNAPSWPIEQLSKGREIYGKNLDDFWRLFMVPGGGHCGSASSYPQVPGTWHTLEALLPWVEEGKAPSYVLATDPADGSGTTKRLCPYPVHAVHEHGPADEYSSYVCR